MDLNRMVASWLEAAREKTAKCLVHLLAPVLWITLVFGRVEIGFRPVPEKLQTLQVTRRAFF